MIRYLICLKEHINLKKEKDLECIDLKEVVNHINQTQEFLSKKSNNEVTASKDDYKEDVMKNKDLKAAISEFTQGLADDGLLQGAHLYKDRMDHQAHQTLAGWEATMVTPETGGYGVGEINVEKLWRTQRGGKYSEDFL